MNLATFAFGGNERLLRAWCGSLYQQVQPNRLRLLMSGFEPFTSSHGLLSPLLHVMLERYAC